MPKRKSSKQAPAAEPFVLKQIPLASIQAGGDGREDAGDIAALADSIRRRGLLQPIVVFRSGLAKAKSFVLAAGRRRVAAVRLLKWKTIPARVFPVAGQEIREATSAAENLDRRDLSPVEEALAVARLARALGVRPEDLERCAGDSAALERAAALLGRSVAWVRQRGTLLRLCPEVRHLVASGRLPLGQAREIAKLASAGDQQDVAGAAVSDWDWDHDRPGSHTDADGVRVQSLAEVRAQVASRLSTLRGVPWKPDVDFAGMPACATCPDNSVNSLLFGVDKDDAAPEARCLNTRCYQTKMRAAEKAVREALEKAAKDKDVAATATGVRDLIPEYVKPATVARQLKRRRELAKPARGRTKGAVTPSVSVPWDKTPEGRFQTALRAWRNRTRRQVGDAICKIPMRLACFLVGVTCPAYTRHIDCSEKPSKAVRKKIDPILKRIAGGTAKDLAALAKGFPGKDVFDRDRWTPLWVVRHLAGLLSITLDPEPKQDDFLPKDDSGRKAKPKGRKAKKKN